MKNPSSIKEIDALWQRLYYIFYGTGHNFNYFNGALILPPKFDEDIMNSVALLKTANTKDLKKIVEDIRAKLSVCETSGLVGHSDMEDLNQRLDVILGFTKSK